MTATPAIAVEANVSAIVVEDFLAEQERVMAATTEPKSRDDSGFGTFLDYMQSRGIGMRSSVTAAAAFAAGSAAAAAAGDQTVANLLALLTAAAAAEAAADSPDGWFAHGNLLTKTLAVLTSDGPQDLAALLTATGTPSLASLLASLNTLQHFSLVARGSSSPPNPETYAATPLGSRTVRALAVTAGGK